MSNHPDGTGDMMEKIEGEIGDFFKQPKITGYRQLNPTEVAKMNEIKEIANAVGVLVESMMKSDQLDIRWVAAARTTLQTGFMQLTRAVAQPNSF